MSNEVKKQHYVWEYYLKAWATDNQIWAKRENKIFPSSTENVAQERYFYKIDPLSDTEINMLIRVFRKEAKKNPGIFLNSLNTYLNIANGNEKTGKFGLEQYYSMTESNTFLALAALRKRKFDILNDRENKKHLCIYLAHQYTRTKKVRSFPVDSVNTQCLDHRNCDLHKVYNAWAFIFANIFGASLCDDLDLRVVENNSSTKLITSDQPIFNILATHGDTPEKNSIYFPISPYLALWAKERPNDESICTDEKAEKLNSFMVKNSLEFVFASSKEELEALAT